MGPQESDWPPRDLFQQEGAQVYVTGAAKRSSLEVEQQLPGVVALRSDAAELEDIDRLAAEIERRSSRLDVLFINAGIARFLPIQQVTPALLDEMFDINFRGPYFTVQRLLPLMPSGASIVLTTSVAADLGLSLSSVYAASKAALSSLARTLSNELSPRGIRVNEVSPGPIENADLRHDGTDAGSGIRFQARPWRGWCRSSAWARRKRWPRRSFISRRPIRASCWARRSGLTGAWRSIERPSRTSSLSDDVLDR